ncbi:hypothetical protein ACFX13_031185 [Malus domestica]
MKLIIHCFFISILLLSPILSIESNEVQSQQYYEDATIDEFSNSPLNEIESQPSNMLRGSDRFLLQKRRVRLTSNKFQRICHAKGSPGTHCCNKCVIVFTESQPSSMLRGSDHFLLQKRQVRLTCNKFPRICHARGSPGTHFCKKCVIVFTESQPSNMLHGSDRFILQKRKVRLTCNKFPKICRAKGSQGTHCCKKCVIVFTDRANCGKKCKYN